MRTSIGVGDVVMVLALEGDKLPKSRLVKAIREHFQCTQADAQRGVKLAKMFYMVREDRQKKVHVV